MRRATSARLALRDKPWHPHCRGFRTEPESPRRRQHARGVAAIELLQVAMILALILFLVVGAGHLRLAQQRTTAEAHHRVFARAAPSPLSTDQLLRLARQRPELEESLQEVEDLAAGLGLAAPRLEPLHLQWEQTYQPPHWLSISGLPEQPVTLRRRTRMQVQAANLGLMPAQRITVDAAVAGVPPWTWAGLAEGFVGDTLGLEDAVRDWHDRAASHCLDSVKSSLKLSDRP